MDPKLEWVVRYADGSEFSNLDGPHHHAPRNGVQEVWYADDRVEICTETSPAGIWLWHNDRWFGCDDQWALWDYLFHYQGPGLCVIFGRTLTDEAWEKRVRDSVAARTAADKTAWTPRERRAPQ